MCLSHFSSVTFGRAISHSIKKVYITSEYIFNKRVRAIIIKYNEVYSYEYLIDKEEWNRIKI